MGGSGRPAKGRESLEGGGGPWAAERVGSHRERDLGWSRYPEASSLRLLPGPAPVEARGEGWGPPAMRGQICWGKGRGRPVTDRGQEGVGS